jgi:hypothetical protein
MAESRPAELLRVSRSWRLNAEAASDGSASPLLVCLGKLLFFFLVGAPRRAYSRFHSQSSSTQAFAVRNNPSVSDLVLKHPFGQLFSSSLSVAAAFQVRLVGTNGKGGGDLDNRGTRLALVC